MEADYFSSVVKNMEHLEQKFFNELAEVLEDYFSKGEKCGCGKKLSCRSSALVLVAKANLLFRKCLKEIKAGKICLNCGREKKSGIAEWCGSCLERE